MHRLSFISFWLAISLALASLAVPIPVPPLGTTPDPAQPQNQEQKDNQDRIDRATDLANKQILKMEHVLNDPNKPENKKMIDAAFGSDPNQRKMQEITDTVQRLKVGTVPVKLATAAAQGQSLGFTSYDQTTNPMTPQHIEFTPKYHAKATGDDGRAGTLIHEATHYLKQTGDYIDANGKMIKGDDHQTTARTGYATGNKPKTTPENLDKDANWKKMRDGHTPAFSPGTPKTQDLHLNAESYAQFGAMAHNAVPDRDVGISSKRPAPLGNSNAGNIPAPPAQPHVPVPPTQPHIPVPPPQPPVKKGAAKKAPASKAKSPANNQNQLPPPPPPPPSAQGGRANKRSKPNGKPGP
ncbi:hypothetical protein CVT26_001102 [Gymnopilus dilepis]|uniref:Lysine-specific metallo-endopeptidase domain-containing protein n=1 Tax=Gymnopilus dilepis TaxID=231916 RepID=A0A409W7L6_9AGAR|nr:hypothetical protein CVT26_001102 [Gymnopilus dilepis]